MKMGCRLSTSDVNDNKTKSKCNGHNVTTSCQGRPYNSNGSSSGFSSAFTLRLRLSLLSRFNSSPSSTQKKVKTKPKIKMLTICDDFHEAVEIQNHQRNKSLGYTSQSLSTQSNVSISSHSLVKSSQLTGTHLQLPPAAGTPTPSDMEMEKYIISRRQQMLLKTSTPVFQRRHVAYDNLSSASPPSHSYQKWAKYIHTPPTHVLYNVADVSEAINVFLSPLNSPPFTNLEEMVSAAKRFKVDIEQRQMPNQSNLGPILTTDL